VLFYLAFLKIKIVNGRKEHLKGIRRIQKGMNGYSNGSEDPIQRQTRTGNGIKLKLKRKNWPGKGLRNG